MKRVGLFVGVALVAVIAGVLVARTVLHGPEAPDAGVVDAGPQQLFEKEPNDRPEQALSLSDSAIVTASLTSDPSHSDEDWYLLAPASPKVVDIAVSGIPGADVAFEVYDSDRARLIAVNSEGEGKPERFPNLGVKDKLYIKVYSARKGSGGAYTFTALFKDPSPGFESEPNDRAVDSNTLVVGQPLSGFVGHSGDEDWYRLELPLPDAGTVAGSGPSPQATASLEAALAAELDGGATSKPADGGTAAPEILEGPSAALKISLTGVPNVRLDLSVMSAAEAPLFQTKSKEGEALMLRNIGVRANDKVVYLVVKSAWSGTGKDAKRGHNAEQPYTLTVGMEEAGANAELEPNDDIAHATPLPQNGFRQGFISPKGDVDYYVLKADPPGLFRVQLSGVEHLDLQLSVVKPGETPKAAEQVLMRVNDGAVKEPEYLNNLWCEGQCWLKVETVPRKVDGKFVRDSENTDQPYKLSVEPVDGNGQEREPNNVLEMATPLALGVPMRGTIQPKRDVDFYKLDISQNQVKTPLKASLLGVLKVDARLELYQVGEDGKPTLVETASKGKGDAPAVLHHAAEPGVYYFKVHDAKDREANFQDSYQLTVEQENE